MTRRHSKWSCYLVNWNARWTVVIRELPTVVSVGLPRSWQFSLWYTRMGLHTANYYHDRSRGHSLRLQKNRVLTDLRQGFFSEIIVNIWNKLDEDIVSAPSINSLNDKLYTDESFPALRKCAWPRGPSHSSGEAQTGELMWMKWVKVHWF